MLRSLIKIIVILVAIPVVLFIVAGAILATIDLNDYRDEIAKAVTDATGRQLSLQGELHKSFFPWLGVNVGALQLSNAKGFDDKAFASIESAQIKVDTLALFKLQLVVDKVVLKGLNLNLARSKTGTTNWDDLVRPTGKEAEPKALEAEGGARAPQEVLAGLLIGGVEVQNAHLEWDDRQSQARYELDKFNFNVSEIALGRPVKLQLATDFSSQTPDLRGHLEVKSNKIQWDLAKKKYSLEPLNVEIGLQGKVLPTDALQVKMKAEISTDLISETVNVNGLEVQTMDLRLEGQTQAHQILTAPKFSGTLKLDKFSPRQLARKLNIALPETADAAVLDSAALDISYAGDANSINLQTLQFNMDDTQLKGDASVKQFDKPAIAFNLDLNTLDVDRYLPPTAQDKTAPEKAAPVTPASTAAAAVQLPTQTLRALNLQGSLKAGSVTASKITTKNILAKISAKNGKISIAPLQADISEGKFSSEIHLDVTENTPKLALTELVTAVKVGPILQAVMHKDILSGTLNLTTELTARGVLVDELKQSLNGKSQFSLANVAVKGINIAEELRKAKTKLKGETYKPSEQPQQTDFTELTGTALITNGVITNNDLSAKSPLLRVTGEGKVDLPADKVNYLVTTYIVGTAQGQAGKDLEELKGLPVPIRFRGPLAAPDYEVDYDTLIKEYKNKYKKEVKKELKQEKRKAEEKLKEEGGKVLDNVEDQLKDKFKKFF